MHWLQQFTLALFHGPLDGMAVMALVCLGLLAAGIGAMKLVGMCAEAARRVEEQARQAALFEQEQAIQRQKAQEAVKP